MKKFLLLTVMCVLGLFGTLRAQETTFSYDFEDGTLTGWRAYQGAGTTTENAWQVAEGKGVDGSMGIYSYSCKLVPPYNIPMEYFVNNYVVTQNAYAITETSVFSWNQGNESIYSDPSCDQITVIVSEDGSDFSTVVWEGTGENTGDLSVSLAEYAGKSLYIGFHHFQTTSYGDGEIRLDNIVLTSEGGSEGGEEPEPEPTPDPETMSIALGSGTETSEYIPINTFYGNSISQQIYTAEEIAEQGFVVGTINSIAFKSASEQLASERDMMIFMVNTDEASFASENGWTAEFSSLTAEDLVYEGKFNVTGVDQWCKVELTTPFMYTGSNLMVCVVDNTNAYLDRTYFYVYESENSVVASYRDGLKYDPYNMTYEDGSAMTGELMDKKNQVQFEVTPAEGITVTTENIDLGTIALGNYWPEKEAPSVPVTVVAVGTTITSIESSDPFFVLPPIDLTAMPIKFNVTHDNTASAGEKTGELTITSTDETVVIPMTAVVYDPVEPDVFELAREITFTDDAYTDTPDFATLHDDYVLPNEGDGLAPDAVYTFSLEEEKIIKAGVEGEGGLFAIYRADSIGEGKGPQANNNYKGTETILSTAVTFDFEDGSLDAFTTQDLDEYTDYCWFVEDGKLKSKSFDSWGEYGTDTWGVMDQADERVITNEAYTITPYTVLTFDMDEDESGTYLYLTVEVTKDGEEFVELGLAETPPYYFKEDYMKDVYPEYFDENGNFITLKRFDLGSLFVAEGLEYGDYRISLHAENGGGGDLLVDNITLTERTGVYEAGDYYLVAAAKAAFTLNVELQGLGGDEPEEEPEFDPEALYRLVSKTGDVSETVYEYTSEKGTTVVSVDQDGLVETMEYTDGVLVGYAAKNGEETLSEVKYTYDANGVMTAYSESTMSWNGNMFTQEYTIEYNTDGKVVSVAASDYKYTFVYDANGLVTEKAANYLYEDGSEELDYKEVYTYENGRLVNTGWYTYDWMLGQEALAEENVYEYDANGNCNKVVTYAVYEDEESGDVVKNIYMVTEYKYSTKVAIENVYTFDYPHMALINPAVPAQANILYNEYTYGIDPETEEVYPYSDVDYIYEAYELEEEQGFGAPTNVNATAISDTKIELSWDAVEGATQYGIYFDDYFLGATPYTGAELIGFEANSTYCFTVTAFDAAGNESEHSEEACATTLDAPTEAPATPTNLVGEYLADTQEIRLTWDPVENADTYNLYLFDMPMGEISGTAVRVGDLDPTVTNYCFRVSAVNTAGESALSEEVCVSTVGVEEMSATFNIYPNPVNDVLFIENSNNIEQVTIYSVTGVMVYSEECTSNNVQVNVADLEAGVYIIKVRTENNEVINRFIKK